MKTLNLTLGTASLLALTVLLAPAASAAAAAGAGTATFGACPADSDVVTLAGVDNGDGTWTFNYALASSCDGYTNNGSSTGAWTPAGGCAGFICLTNPSGSAPGAITYAYSNGAEAHSGSVTLVVA